MTIRAAPAYELKDELARLCLPSASRDANLKLAWVNSVCILFLLIGIVGARRGLIAIKPAPPIEEVIPVVVEPLTLPPQETDGAKTKPRRRQTMTRRASRSSFRPAPNISFSVPTIGSLVVPANLASAPPLEPLRTAVQIGSAQQHRHGRRTAATAVSANRAGRRRARHGAPHAWRRCGGQCDFRGREGIIRLSGAWIAARVEFIKRHWRLPTGAGSQLFETNIIYKLQLN